MPSLIKRRNGYWYIKWSVNGEPFRRSLHTTDERVARETFVDFDYNFRHKLLGLHERKRMPLLNELFDDYLLYMRNHRAPATYTAAELYVRIFLRPAFGHLPADQLTSRQIEAFIFSLKNKQDDKGNPAPYHPDTINKRLKCLNAVYNRAIEANVIDKKPVHIKLLHSPRPLPRYITPEQFEAWAAHINKPLNRCRAIIEICTGAPDTEIGKFTWSGNYNEDAGTLRYTRGKTKIEIVVNLNLWALEAIAYLKTIQSGPYIFHGQKSARRAYEVASKNSGIHATPNTMRHSFATWALSEGEAIQKISAILGHASISTTQIYARVMPTWRAQTTGAIDRLRPASVKFEAPEKPQEGQNRSQSIKEKKPVDT